MSIIISQDGKKAQKIDKQEIEKENYLQKYIHENPESIPVYEIEEDKKLLVVAREFRTESGPIDALAVDQDGDIYVVETKLYKNPDKRTVVAQALDYGASLWRHSNFDEFISKINSEISDKFKISFEEKLKEFFNIDDERVILALDSIKRNLQDGNIKFVILMDSVEDRLKDLIVYVNQNSQFDIYAVQMEYYKFEKYEIIIPKLFGVEVKKSVASSSAGSARRKWDEQGFFEEAKKILPASDIEPITKLYDFSKNSSDEIHWGTGVNRSSFSVRFDKLGNKPLFVIYSDGEMKISIEYPKKGANQKQIANLDRLNTDLKAIGMEIDPASERTAFLLEEWGDKVEDIIKNIDKIIK
jgi:hypothetical protein